MSEKMIAKTRHLTPPELLLSDINSKSRGVPPREEVRNTFNHCHMSPEIVKKKNTGSHGHGAVAIRHRIRKQGCAAERQ